MPWVNRCSSQVVITCLISLFSHHVLLSQFFCSNQKSSVLQIPDVYAQSDQVFELCYEGGDSRNQTASVGGLRELYSSKRTDFFG